MVDKERALALVSDIKDEFAGIDSIAASLSLLPGKIKKAPGEDRIHLVESAGLELHNFYVACARIFRKIAGEINGGTPSSLDRHARLLNIMTLEMENKRPPVLKKETARELAEYLKFRHLIMNIYGFELQFERMLPLIKPLPK